MQTKVRVTEADAANAGGLGESVQQIFNDTMDVAVIRNAFPADVLSAVARTLDSSDSPPPWTRPNRGMPGNDIQILGTDTPATPTFRDPRGASLDAYLTGASGHTSATTGVFGEDFDVEPQIRQALQRLSGSLPLEVPIAADGRRYVPYTVRRLGEGQEISLHHDYYFQLGLYADLAPRLDPSTIVSFFVTLQSPESGGQIVVYALRSDDPNQPRLPGGRWDAQAIQNGFPYAAVSLNPGDLILLASGRFFHRVEPVVGPRSRITLGGFLGLSKDRSRVFYWS